MAYSTQRVVSDGSLVLLSISIGYLERSHIHVFFNDVENDLPWSWVGLTDNQIAFSPAVPNGVSVLVARKTDLSEPYHIFTQGAQFTAESLDEDIQQVLFIAQEATEQSLTGDFYQDVNMHGYNITNLSDAVLPGDAVTLSQTVSLVLPYSTAASSSASAANTSASAAAASATAASNSAIAAAGYTVPSQIGNAGKVLGTNGSTLSWQFSGFASGTRMVFAQAAAPIGWTQDTTDAADSRMLRVVRTAGGGYSGSHSPILNNVVPSHTHTISIGNQSANHTHSGTTGGQSADHTHGYSQASSNNWTTDFGTTRFTFDQNGAANTGGASSDHTHTFTTTGVSENHYHGGTIAANTGASDWTPRYIDLIICVKN